ncbi:hypothetical protein DSL72_008118 [Monilinia vaccinii-corymbosi]|uniref:Uncharacterized protein n=1 Tax=Monilinia vaccinii-corymbosi TaxID=61207 RepID=A0A8A3PJS7_9HELO|nr:hypothetical protein DSL72_008118 [Monilinia vaccinii-corymbosi]
MIKTTVTPRNPGPEPLYTLYYLAEKIRMPPSMDRIMDAIPGYFKKGGSFTFSIRDMQGNKIWMQKVLALDNACPDLFKDILAVLSTHGTAAFAITKDPKAADLERAFGKCGFHVHDPDGFCYTQASDVEKEMGEQKNGTGSMSTTSS